MTRELYAGDTVTLWPHTRGVEDSAVVVLEAGRWVRVRDAGGHVFKVDRFDVGRVVAS